MPIKEKGYEYPKIQFSFYYDVVGQRIGLLSSGGF